MLLIIFATYFVVCVSASVILMQLTGWLPILVAALLLLYCIIISAIGTTAFVMYPNRKKKGDKKEEG